ncbi:MAG: hypothetical protein DRN06_07255 [Thermoprotei archaeon]|nr:MAG: hypothetical protein DRN06_07255 [Thermoprotei archaeon]
MDDELLLAVAELVEALEDRDLSIRERVRYFITKINDVRKELERAEQSARCSLVKQKLNKLLEEIEKEGEWMKRVEAAYAALEEQGIEQSWRELDEETKNKLKRRVETMLR